MNRSDDSFYDNSRSTFLGFLNDLDNFELNCHSFLIHVPHRINYCILTFFNF